MCRLKFKAFVREFCWDELNVAVEEVAVVRVLEETIASSTSPGALNVLDRLSNDFEEHRFVGEGDDKVFFCSLNGKDASLVLSEKACVYDCSR